ncbi:MAG: MAPEG family protein [Pseudomonadota bacterium]
MKFVAIVAVLNLANYILVLLSVGRARRIYGVPAPATTGAPEFERALRIQQNSLEQLIVFVPSLFLFATYIDPVGAAALGLVFLIGRIIYQRRYSRGENRGPGFLLGFVANIVLLAGTLAGVIWNFSELT